jgi:hypothetical protein
LKKYNKKCIKPDACHFIKIRRSKVALYIHDFYSKLASVLLKDELIGIAIGLVILIIKIKLTRKN